MCGKLSTNDNITLSPAVGGRKNTERRKRTATRACTAKTNRPDFFRGKQSVFPSGRKPKQEADANHPFPRNAALGRLRSTEVANHGARAVIDSELRIKNDEDVFCNSRKRIKRPLAPAHRRRPNANSFFEKPVTGKHTKKEFGRTSRAKLLCKRLSSNLSLICLKFLSLAVGERKTIN